MVCLKTAVLFLVLLGATVRAAPEHRVYKRETRCYNSNGKQLGCFKNSAPFDSMPVPESPKAMGSTFYLYTRQQKSPGKKLAATNLAALSSAWPEFKRRPTKIIIHGYTTEKQYDYDTDSSSWMKKAKDELLTNGDYNVITVVWIEGSGPDYNQAAANTRVMGALVAQLVQNLQDTHAMTAEDFHIIGFSLGAQVAGFAGKGIRNLKRITGLDPAGQIFNGSPIEARLDQTDAVFVDSIHTDGEPLLSGGLGTMEAGGDQNFYPNNGADQPGCSRNIFSAIWDHGLIGGIIKVFSCDHKRAYQYFIESINSECPFTSFPCDRESDWTGRKCNDCSPGGCPVMGFHADRDLNSQRSKFYLNTANSSPFCRLNLILTVTTSSSQKSERGYLFVKLVGTKKNADKMKLNKDAIYFDSSKTYTFNVGSPSNLGNLDSAVISWDHSGEWTNPFSWGWWGLRSPELVISYVEIKTVDFKKSARLCDSDETVSNHGNLAISRGC